MVKLFHVIFNGPYIYYIHTLNNTDNKYKNTLYDIRINRINLNIKNYTKTL